MAATTTATTTFRTQDGVVITVPNGMFTGQSSNPQAPPSSPGDSRPNLKKIVDVSLRCTEAVCTGATRVAIEMGMHAIPSMDPLTRRVATIAAEHLAHECASSACAETRDAAGRCIDDCAAKGCI